LKGGSTSNLVFGTGGTVNLQSISGGINLLTTNRNISLSGDLTINGTLNYNSSTFTVGANTLTLNGTNISGTPANFITTSSSGLTIGGSTSGLNIPSSVANLNNLSILNSNGATANSSITLAGNLQLNAGVLNLGTNDLNIGGTVTCGSGTISATGGTVSLTGSGDSYLPVGTYYNVNLNRTGSTVSLCGSATVNNVLTLTNGVLALGKSDLTIAVGGSISGTGFSGSKMIRTDGTGLLKIMAANVSGFSNLTFPIGTLTDYTPFVLNSITST